MRTHRNSHLHSVSMARAKFSAIVCFLAVLFGLLAGTASQTLAQAVRRPAKAQQRIQKKLDKQEASKLTTADDTERSAAKPPETAVKQGDAPSPQQNNLEGIRERGIITLFTREEQQLIIPGFGRPPGLLIVFRQLNLTLEQKQKIRAIRMRVGRGLQILQQERGQLEQQLEDAIYGESFSMEKVDQLAAQAAEKQGEIIKLQANIEAQFRQILTPDQFYVFQFLIGEMVLPQRRMTPQQQLRRFGNPQNPQNPQNRPNRPPLDQEY